MYILQLPKEVIVHTLEYLNFRTLINCSETCRSLHTIAQNTPYLRYNNELEIAGLIDTGSVSSLSVAERLEQLETIERNWATLTFRLKVGIPKPVGRNIWEFFGGVFTLGTSGGRGLSYTELPSLTRRTPTCTWKHDDLGVDIREFGTDPSQDLVVLIEVPTGPRADEGVYSIHLRSMRTGDQHRCATQPIIFCIPQFFLPGGVPEYPFVIQIMGDFLGLLFQTLIEYVVRTEIAFVWNWKTGQIAVKIKSNKPFRRFDSFSFISPRHILISTHTPHSEFRPTLEIYDFVFPRNIVNPPPIRIFEFPVFCSGVAVRSTRTRSRSDLSAEKPGHAAIQGGRPFVTAPTARLLTVNIQASRVVHGLVEPVDFMMFVHHDSLLDGIGSPGPILVPWMKWGPNKTRLLRMRPNSYPWICYIRGTRFVCMERTTDLPAEQSHIKLLDFNPLSIKRQLKLSEVESSRVTVTTFSASEPTVIDQREDVFVETVATSLPYREVLSVDRYPYEAVMIDDDCFIGIRRGLMSGENGVEFLYV
ncbi:hypothetical protein BU17DRAFT_90347 [Hysterangium stoloniferum]|nr:hypothetical protein BU17DRAFT_90347 [Hysterangium stoloniferum]